MRSSRFLLPVLAVATLLLIGLFTVGKLDQGARRNQGALVEAVLNMLVRCSSEIACIERETDRLIVVTGVIDVIAAASTVYAADPTHTPNCHIYMHMLGTHLTARVLTGDVPALGTGWTACGAGLVHGAFSDIPLDPSDAAGLHTIVTLCDDAEFAEPLYRHHACLHAIGHAVHAGTEGDLAHGEALCLRGVPADETFARNHPCLAGLYMVDRDERLAAAPAPQSIDGWGSLLNHCQTSPRPDVCVSAYFELATKAGADEAVSYFDWCHPVGGETCLYLLGQHGAFRQLADTSARETTFDLGICLMVAAERALNPSPCTEGAAQALAASGVVSERLTDEVCRLVVATGARSDDCP